jgi:haloacetate dehalogenase
MLLHGKRETPICEDYRAAATVDLEHDAADAERRLGMPLLALWGAKGVVGQLYEFRPCRDVWRDRCCYDFAGSLGEIA